MSLLDPIVFPIDPTTEAYVVSELVRCSSAQEQEARDANFVHLVLGSVAILLSFILLAVIAGH